MCVLIHSSGLNLLPHKENNGNKESAVFAEDTLAADSGDIIMSKTKRQHYIPRFYLRNFAADEKKKTIIQFSLDKKEIASKASIKSVGSKEHMYGEDAAFLEDCLAENEKRWGGLLGNIIDGNRNFFSSPESFGLTEENLVDFLLFIFSMDSRTLYRADQFNALLQSSFKNHLLKNGYDENKAGTPIDELQLVAKMPDGSKAPDAIIPMYLKSISTSLIFDLRRILIINTTAEKFITSDAPVIRYNQFCTLRNVEQETRLTSMGLIIFFPITPEICVCLYDDTVYDTNPRVIEGKVSLQNEDDVEMINKLITENAYQFIYCRNHTEEALNKLAANWKPSLSLKREIESKPQISFLKLKERYVKYRIPTTDERWIRKKMLSKVTMGHV